MEGVLWKWTNYWNGWQPRWFILDDGILAYYKSQEEVNQGCKGSLRITACEISVNQADPLRLDLSVPGEQQFYLRASTSQERQQWLVALGSAKACVNITKNLGEPEFPSFPSTAPERDILKSKRSELRLYCDLLMQQVHSVKDAATQQPRPDVEKMDESSLLLSATCDTFITTLEDCLRLAKAEFTYQLPHSHPTDTALNGNASHHNDVLQGLPFPPISPTHSTSSSGKKRSAKKNGTKT